MCRRNCNNQRVKPHREEDAMNGKSNEVKKRARQLKPNEHTCYDIIAHVHPVLFWVHQMLYIFAVFCHPRRKLNFVFG